jgi:hypothetical protein
MGVIVDGRHPERVSLILLNYPSLILFNVKLLVYINVRYIAMHAGLFLQSEWHSTT